MNVDKSGESSRIQCIGLAITDCIARSTEVIFICEQASILTLLLLFYILQYLTPMNHLLIPNSDSTLYTIEMVLRAQIFDGRWIDPTTFTQTDCLSFDYLCKKCISPP